MLNAANASGGALTTGWATGAQVLEQRVAADTITCHAVLNHSNNGMQHMLEHINSYPAWQYLAWHQAMIVCKFAIKT